MGTSTLNIDNQGTGASARSQSFSTRAAEQKKFAAGQRGSELKTLSVLAAFADPSGKNPPAYLENLSASLQSGKNFRQAVSELAGSELADLRAKVGADLLPQLISLAGESQEEMYFAGLLNLGQRLKANQDLDKASLLLGMLSQNSPESIRSIALSEVQALQGQGASALRTEVLLSRLAKDSCDWRAIAPMIGASVIGQVAGTAFMSRLAATDATLFSRGWGLRFASGAASFLAEFPAYAGFNRLLATQSEGSFSDELQRSALTIGVLKTFGFIGNQAFLKAHGFSELGVPTRLTGLARFDQALFPQATMFAGLMVSHKLEERWGLRPQVDDATTVTDTLASLLTLGAGSHLGHSILGGGFAKFQRELALRGEIFGNFSPPGSSASRQPLLSEMLERLFPKLQKLAPAGGLPEGWLAMAATENPGIQGARSVTEDGSVAKPGTIRFPKINHPLSTYQKYARESLMGDPLKNIRARLEKKRGPVAVLDIGSGKGLAAQEIKERFKDKVRVETNDLDPLVSELVDRHHEGSFLSVDFQKQYDLAFAIFGPHAYPEGKLKEMVQKTSELLLPDGEFFATLNSGDLAEESNFLLKDFDTFSKIQEALQLGWVLRLEKFDGGKMLYMRRIGDAKVPDWSRVISSPNLSLSERSREELRGEIVQKLLRADLSSEGVKLRFELPELEEISSNLVRLGVHELLERPEDLLQTLLERFVSRFREAKRRVPDDYETKLWLTGREPSPTHRHPILIDELIRARVEQGASEGTKNPIAKFEAPNHSETPPIQISRQLFTTLSGLKTSVEKLPESNPHRRDLLGRADVLLKMAREARPDSDFWPEISRIEAEVNHAWEATLNRRSNALLPAMEELAEKFPEGSLKTRLAQWKENSAGDSAGDFRRPIEKLQEIFSLAIKEVAEQFWHKNFGSELPMGLRQSLTRAMSGILACDLFSEKLSADVLQEFVETFTGFYHDFPPPPFSLMETITPDSNFTAHSLLGSKPDANGYLRNVTLNLRGYRDLLGPDAGALFHREARLVSPIKSPEGENTGFSLVVEKGSYEFENGIKISIFPFEPRLSHTTGELAKIGIHFGEKGNLRLVNIQGSYRTPFDEFENQRPVPLSTLLGGAHPLDMLIATAILLGRNAGYEKIEGIRDAAQGARLDLKRGKKGQGFYDLFFRRFGFNPPDPSEDYWTLNLQDLSIYRKPKAATPENSAPRHFDFGDSLSLMDYFAEILPRKNRNAHGRNVRPESWDRQAADVKAPQVQAFWKSVAPALSHLAWQAGPAHSMDRPILPFTSHPFELGDLKSPLSETQRKFIAQSIQNLKNSNLSKEASQAFEKLLG